jgi:putative FmdB family regulatory protein
VPLYEYKCLKCARRTEKIERVDGPHLKKCPHCGGKVESVITAPAIQFKGSGWYVTDYAGKSTAGGSKEEKSSSNDKDEKKAGASKEGHSKGTEKSEKSEKSEKADKSDRSEKSEKSDSSTKEKSAEKSSKKK